MNIVIITLILVIIGMVVGYWAWSMILGVIVIQLPILNHYYRHQKHISRHKPYIAVKLFPAVLLLVIIIVPSLFWSGFFYGQLGGLILFLTYWKEVVRGTHESMIAQLPGVEKFIKPRN